MSTGEKDTRMLCFEQWKATAHGKHWPYCMQGHGMNKYNKLPLLRRFDNVVGVRKLHAHTHSLASRLPCSQSKSKDNAGVRSTYVYPWIEQSESWILAPGSITRSRHWNILPVFYGVFLCGLILFVGSCFLLWWRNPCGNNLGYRRVLPLRRFTLFYGVSVRDPKTTGGCVSE